LSKDLSDFVLSDDEGKMMMSDSTGVDNDLPTRGGLGDQHDLHADRVGPAQFLELYRTRTVSDPRSDQRLAALSHVRMRKVNRITSCIYCNLELLLMLLLSARLLSWRERQRQRSDIQMLQNCCDFRAFTAPEIIGNAGCRERMIHIFADLIRFDKLLSPKPTDSVVI